MNRLENVGATSMERLRSGLAAHLDMDDIEDDDALFGRGAQTLVPDLLVHMCANAGQRAAARCAWLRYAS